MAETEVVVVGAGVGGLSAAIDLASAGLRVKVIEKAAKVGGKLRSVVLDGLTVDAGPTVLTMRWAFDELFARAGHSLDDHVRLDKSAILARHAWSAGRRLDLFADAGESRRAIAGAFGEREADGFEQFCCDTARIYAAIERPFLRSHRPTVSSSLRALGVIARIDAHRSMWRALSQYFRSRELRQLFGRYATYVGSSPMEAPATLNLIAHVESQGVWRVNGGMATLGRALETVARSLGVELVFEAEVASIEVHGDRVTGVRLRTGERVGARAVVVNADVSALGGMLSRKAPPSTRPRERSLSAITWACAGTASDLPLVHHNVFFSDDYPAECRALFQERRVPDEPTVYVCAQRRGDEPTPGSLEPFLTIMNAPATGDDPRSWTSAELRRCEEAASRVMERGGLSIRARASEWTTPRDFEASFPRTGGALYGPAARGALHAFRREGSRTKVAGLYLAGGSVHPGPGLPMASLSGQLAASCVTADLASTLRSSRVAISGSTSTA